MEPDRAPEPAIISRSEHIISRKNIDREALKVLYRLRDAGYVAYLVGGGVRDLYLGKEPKDFDISTNARPGELRKLFRNSRIIGRRFRLVQVFFHGGKIVEVSTFRCRNEEEEEGGDAVLASNNTFGSEAEDAFRRDLTINALFYEIENFSIIDYTGGVADLKAGIIRIIGDPERRITRDPVRMIRAIRHAARTGFTINEETWAAIVAHAEKLACCPSSRLRDELVKDLRSGASLAWFDLARGAGILSHLLSCYNEKFFNSTEHALDRLRQCLTVLDRLHGAGQKFTDPMIFSLLLLPWAEIEFDLLAIREQRDRGKVFESSRRIRGRLDEALGQLNITRAAKESISALFATLPLIRDHDRNNSWPKWLSRKSYFQEGLTLYKMYRESLGGPAVTVKVETSSEIRSKGNLGGGRHPRREGRQPAFSSKQGGVFGLKA